ncbi:HAD family hydrolase [uncultured Fibrobacter sp.]|uniref:HAD family hydrolase n=1 Tax=uncultured Fibrobacter sp. TaxID=261512 RepID=UPI0025EA7BFC|nr:HAD-IA family hydrolase [uncultured Fibrobacter sp.]
MLKKKSLIVFDLDGTLFNTLGDLAVAVNFALRQFGLPEHDEQRVRTFIGNGTMKLIERSMGEAALPENIAHTGVTIEMVHKVYSDFYWEHCTERTLPNPGVVDFLHTSKARIAMLTNKPLRPTEKILNHFGLRDCFEFILCGDTTPERKPSPAGLLKILEMAGASREDAVMVGDDQPDILAARNAGVDCVTLLCGFGKPVNLLPLKLENTVKSYAEMCAVLNGCT